VSLTPREYAFATPQDLGGRAGYRSFCKAVGLKPAEGPYGFLLCEDDDAQRWTAVTTDVDYLRLLVDGERAGALADLEMPADKFPVKRAGWPDDWARP